jgi:hypothetical protein
VHLIENFTSKAKGRKFRRETKKESGKQGVVENPDQLEFPF